MNKYCINSAQTFINRISPTSPQKIIDYCAIDLYLLTDQYYSIGKIKWDFRTHNIIILIQMNEQLKSIIFESKLKSRDIEEKLKQLSFKHQNNKAWYYFLNNLRRFFPSIIFRNRLERKLRSLKEFDVEYIQKRVRLL